MSRSCQTCFKRQIDACPRIKGPYSIGSHEYCWVPSVATARKLLEEITRLRAELERVERERDAISKTLDDADARRRCCKNYNELAVSNGLALGRIAVILGHEFAGTEAQG